MKIILVSLVLILSLVSLSFAQDIPLSVKLTANQQQHLSDLNGAVGGIVNGASYHTDTNTIVLVATRDLTDKEMGQARDAVNALPDVAIPIVPIVPLEQRISTLETKTAALEAKVK